MAPHQIGVQATAIITGSALSGAMLCLSAITVPVFLDTDNTSSHLVRQWARTYHYGHIILPAVCIGTCGLYAYITLTKRATGRKHWPTYAAAGMTTLAMVPFTRVLMTPTNNALFGLEKASSETADGDLGAVRQLVVTWSWLHVTRSLFPLVGAIAGLRGLLEDLGV